ncbi:uncharacterized protein LOC135824635 [Sycon ciliatum]|uniref:uncharacterized protein LOC135824635 n=1 Tax=Sycon ciliatum TaxID=27933 RepID=UPI0020ADC415|eukprot:scpid37644/ scgid1716/ 
MGNVQLQDEQHQQIITETGRVCTSGCTATDRSPSDGDRSNPSRNRGLYLGGGGSTTPQHHHAHHHPHSPNPDRPASAATCSPESPTPNSTSDGHEQNRTNERAVISDLCWQTLEDSDGFVEIFANPETVSRRHCNSGLNTERRARRTMEIDVVPVAVAALSDTESHPLAFASPVRQRSTVHSVRVAEIAAADAVASAEARADEEPDSYQYIVGSCPVRAQQCRSGNIATAPSTVSSGSDFVIVHKRTHGVSLPVCEAAEATSERVLVADQHAVTGRRSSTAAERSSSIDSRKSCAKIPVVSVRQVSSVDELCPLCQARIHVNEAFSSTDDPNAIQEAISVSNQGDADHSASGTCQAEDATYPSVECDRRRGSSDALVRHDAENHTSAPSPTRGAVSLPRDERHEQCESVHVRQSSHTGKQQKHGQHKPDDMPCESTQPPLAYAGPVRDERVLRCKHCGSRQPDGTSSVENAANAPNEQCSTDSPQQDTSEAPIDLDEYDIVDEAPVKRISTFPVRTHSTILRSGDFNRRYESYDNYAYSAGARAAVCNPAGASRPRSTSQPAFSRPKARAHVVYAPTRTVDAGDADDNNDRPMPAMPFVDQDVERHIGKHRSHFSRMSESEKRRWARREKPMASEGNRFITDKDL